jgi:hypothetical protein
VFEGADLGLCIGAGDGAVEGAVEGNRSLMTSLEGCAYHIAAQAIPRSAWMAIARE